jgi:hypothetical protein
MENQDSKKFHDINNILKTWNPLLVPEPALESEYTEIIPKIQSSSKDAQTIFLILEDYVINFLGTNYDRNNSAHVNELKNVAENINKILREK